MNIGTACAIFEQLDSDKYTDDEKAIAIYKVMNMPTHNGITEDDIFKSVKWLLKKCYQITEDEEELYYRLSEKEIQNLKSEAVIEFARKLRNYLSQFAVNGLYNENIVGATINDLLKRKGYIK
jgi:hypothetical protein